MKNEKIKPSSAQSFKRFDKLDFCRKKINTFQEMITNTILAVQQYKIKDIIGASELNVCIQGLESLFEELNKIKSMIEKNSGTTLSNVSKNLDYLVVGEKPTKKKIDQAQLLDVRVISQEELQKLLN